jgi:hypothetical protein
MKSRVQKLDRALVIDGSMGGLLAARVLADHYKEVTILERDEFPPIGAQSRGDPHGRHTHGVLASGRVAIERLFPGISNDLVEAGAMTVMSPGTRAGLTKEPVACDFRACL